MAATPSVWKSLELPSFERLDAPRKFDVVVVGGGFTGLTAAYFMALCGKRVGVLERYHLGAGDTGSTTAHLTAVSDLRLSKIADHFGRDAAALVWRGGMDAIAAIERVARDCDCEFERLPGYLHLSLDGDDQDRERIAKDAELAREFGGEAEMVSAVPYFGTPGIRFSNQAKFHPYKYLAALAKFVVDREGCVIFEDSAVTDVEDDPLAVVVNENTRVECDHLVIATHVPLMGNAGMLSALELQSKLAPYTSYVVGAEIPRGVVPKAMFWDTSNPYYYLRVDAHNDHDYLIFGGKDVKTGQVEDDELPFRELSERFGRLFPQATIERHWSGQVIETNDGLPYIGETAPNQFAITGFGGNGITFGTLGAMMACDYILGRDNPWADLLSAQRRKVRGGTWDYLRENFDYPYYMLRDRVAAADAKRVEDVAPGEGKLIDIDGQRLACYRDEQGTLTKLSATCTHMGCFVSWNSAERTWDCPCHGSRFLPTGEVLAGPAESALEPSQKDVHAAK